MKNVTLCNPTERLGREHKSKEDGGGQVEGRSKARATNCTVF